MTFLSVPLSGHEYLQSVRLLDAKYFEVITLYTNEGDLKSVDEVVTSKEKMNRRSQINIF